MAASASASAVGVGLGTAGRPDTGDPTAEGAAVADGGDPRTERMAARLVALLALAQRAQFERQGRPLPTTWDAVIDWVESAGAVSGLQPHEQAILRRPTGALDEAEVAMASWQVEGAVVVTWALGLLDALPPTDEPVDPVLVSAAVGFPDGARTLEVLQSARSRRPQEINAQVDRHERILHTLEAASAVSDRPVSGRDRDAVDVVRGITTERLRALHWLQGAGRHPAVAVDG